jgi:hypothetical protein
MINPSSELPDHMLTLTSNRKRSTLPVRRESPNGSLIDPGGRVVSVETHQSPHAANVALSQSPQTNLRIGQNQLSKLDLIRVRGDDQPKDGLDSMCSSSKCSLRSKGSLG